MSSPNLKDRIRSYSDKSIIKLTERLPVITVVNGRSFAKLTSLLDKPFSETLAQCFYSALVGLMQEMDGAIFGYCFNDEIVIISRNDQSQETQPWYDNDIQKIASVSSSIATLQFNNYVASLDLGIMGEPIFYSHVFVVPNIVEAINALVAKQQQAFLTSVSSACSYELLKKYNKNDIKDMLAGTTIDDKINLLQQECQIDFNDYPSAFRRGVACYRASKVVLYEGKETVKQKITLNSDLPIFTKDHAFLGAIFKNGYDPNILALG